jgi:phosphoheptose isomerase
MNLVDAAEKAKQLGLKIFSLSGKGGGILNEMSDICVTVKSSETSFIQEAHITLIHSICRCIDVLDAE